MFDSTTIAVTIFVIAYVLIISEKVHRTIVGIRNIFLDFIRGKYLYKCLNSFIILISSFFNLEYVRL